jgi:uncharacterized lipoprotein YbaY
MKMIPLVKGEITFETDIQPFSGATIYIRLEDITFTDAASKVIAEYVEQNVSFNPKTNNIIPFTIVGQAPDLQANYVVSVHIDIDKDGEVSSGDFLNTQSYPVITYGYPNQVSIIVHQVM